jgi:hypothetical protein
MKLLGPKVIPVSCNINRANERSLTATRSAHCAKVLRSAGLFAKPSAIFLIFGCSEIGK